MLRISPLNRFGLGNSGANMKASNTLLFALLFATVLSVNAPAHAYLDPGTGSMLVQLLLGGVAGALVVGKLYWHRIKAFFGRQPVQSASREPASDADGE